jgi:hypothetical protein
MHGISWSQCSQWGPLLVRRRVTDHWFVSVETPKKRQLSPRKSTRQTTTFPTEAEAKQFAKKMLADGRKIMAGTLLSVHQPTRRIISGWELRLWIEEEG